MTEHIPAEPTEITLDERLYDQFNQAICKMEGMPFDLLAAERPTDAYKILTRVFGEFSKRANTVTFNDTKVSKMMDGEEATSGFARLAFEELTVDTDVEPIDVVVSVFGKQNFREALRGRKPQPKQVVSFRVEPPNLAF